MPKKMTRGERVIAFIETFCVVPEGTGVGQPMVLAPFQKKWIKAVYDNKAVTRRAILAIARKNGKTALIASIMLAHIIGPEAVRNSQVVSGAMSRDQAALVFNLAAKMLQLNPDLEGLYRVVTSGKRIIGMAKNVEYRALAADGTTAHGLSPKLAVLDEVGQIKGPMSPFVEAILTSQGAYEDAIQIFISTQASADADFFSMIIDDAERSADPKTVSHVYCADPNADLMDKRQWKKANPALGLFRSEADLAEQLKQAQRLPSMEASSRNLLLNQRVSLDSLAFAPGIVKENNGESSWDVFRASGSVHLGLDLSRRNDLTAAVICCLDEDEVMHVKTFGFTPRGGVEERSRRDKVPYREWVDREVLYAPDGEVVDYSQVCEYLKLRLREEEVAVSTIQFDDWQILEFRAAAERVGFGTTCQWQEVRQGYKSISPRVQALETALLQRRVLLDNNPVMNMALANAIVVSDPAGNRKISKPKQHGPKVDALLALLMAAYPLLAEPEGIPSDVGFWIA